MILFVCGGSGSGKSAFAEQKTVELSKGTGGRRLYLATMEAYDEESRKRVERHRRMRKDKDFLTLECQTHLEKVAVLPQDTVLLECISNLTANEMYGETGRKESIASLILEGIERLASSAAHLIIVGNNVFEDGTEYSESTQEYVKVMAEIQNQVAALADEVVEVVCGIPIWMKQNGIKERGMV